MKNHHYLQPKLNMLYQVLLMIGISTPFTMAQVTPDYQTYRIAKAITPTLAGNWNTTDNSIAIDHDNNEAYNYLTFGSLDVYRTLGSQNAYTGLQSIGAIKGEATLTDWYSGSDKYNLVKSFQKLNLGYLEVNRDYCSGRDECISSVTSSEEHWLMTLLKNGNVGIGTSTPAQMLDVNGTIQAGGFKLPTGAGLGKILTSDAYGVASWQSGSSLTSFVVGNNPTPSSAARVGTLKLAVNSQNADDSWWMGFTHGSSNSSDGNDRARIGVNIKEGGAGRLFFTTGLMGEQKERMRIDENGWVGIGTSAPTSVFDVRGNGSFFPNVTSGNTGVQLYLSASVNNSGWIGTKNNYGLYLGTNSKGNMYLDTANNVFVGFANLPIPTVTSVKSKYDLFVNTGILSQDYALAPVSSWSDYVFEKNYKLKKLNDLEAYIQQNKHLPNIPSQAEIAKEGYSVHEMNIKFLEKIEELTLHVIEQNKEIELLKKQVNDYQSLAVELQAIKNLLNKK